MYVNRGSVMAIGIIFPILGILVVTARFYTVIKRRMEIGVADWLCLPALLLVCVTGGLYIAGSVTNTIGAHSPPQTFEQALFAEDSRQTLLVTLENVICYLNPIGTGLIRLSFLFWYRRLFRGKVFNILSWTMIGIVIAWSTTFFILLVSMCGDKISVAWQSPAKSAQVCLNTLAILGALGISSFILDCIIITIPFVWIWRLQMKTPKKIGVSLIFSCGLFTIAASALRMTGNIQILNYKWGEPRSVVGYTSTNDTYGIISIFLFWQYVEHGSGLVVCCLPSLKPLLDLKPVQQGIMVLQSWPNKLILSMSRGRSASSYTSSTLPVVDSDNKLPEDRIKVTRTVDQVRLDRDDDDDESTTQGEWFEKFSKHGSV